MRVLFGLLAAMLGLLGCGPGADDIPFEGQFFRTQLKDTEARHRFIVTASPVSASLEGAREAARYEATIYCVRNFGNSRITWRVGPDDPVEVLPIANDTLTLEGECPQ
ncbi:MAG: hypothetical protein AAF636_17690 [Pseudomonadota bacterium]